MIKTPAFWFKEKSMAATLLWPFTILWQFGGILRRFFAKPYTPNVQTICIGNIVMGGAGKTPCALKIAQILTEKGHKPVFITQGYGGTLNGPIKIIPQQHTAAEAGDEALLLAAAAPCYMGKNRTDAMKMAIAHEQPSHLILDDGLQNPHFQAQCNLLVLDSMHPVGNGKIFPSGPLRESLPNALQRISAVILLGDQNTLITQQLAAHNRQIPCFSAQITLNLPTEFSRHKPCLAFAGIGRPAKFYDSCKRAGLNLAATQEFPDHHPFTTKELENLLAEATQNNWQLVTTTKDFVRIPSRYKTKIIPIAATLQFENEQGLYQFLTPSPQHF